MFIRARVGGKARGGSGVEAKCESGDNEIDEPMSMCGASYLVGEVDDSGDELIHLLLLHSRNEAKINQSQPATALVVRAYQIAWVRV